MEKDRIEFCCKFHNNITFPIEKEKCLESIVCIQDEVKNSSETEETLTTIGDLKSLSVIQEITIPDYWIERSDKLVPLTGPHPFNAEPSMKELYRSGLITKNELFFVRNHGDVPRMSWETHSIEFTGLVEKECTLKMDDLIKMFESITITVTLACDGNRRKELNSIKHTMGFSWGPGGVSTAEWKGILLYDIIAYLKPKKEAKFILFEGADKLQKGNYGTSIPIELGLDGNKKIILAYEMNGVRLPPDHGFPCRMIIPGMVGGRMVKWLTKIELSENESTNYYHLHDNKVLPPEIGQTIPDNKDIWERTPQFSLYELNINSAIMDPSHLEHLIVQKDNMMEEYQILGYAYTGGMRKIVRVEVTLNNGNSWIQANIMTLPGPVFSCIWVHFQAKVPIWKFLNSKEIAVRAYDSAFNTQPENPTWNIKGMMNNCWYRIKLEIRETEKGVEITFLHPTVPGHAVSRDGWMISSEVQRLQHQPHKAVFTDNKTAKCTFSQEEIAKHNKSNDCWIILNGSEVYDVTSYLNEHPGGKSSILQFGGKDCTRVFRDIHSTVAHEIKRWFLIGNVETEGQQISKKDVLLNPKKWQKAVLVERREETHNTRRFIFQLENHSNRSLGLPLGQHLLLGIDKDDKFIIRPYTPISPVSEEEDKDGIFELCVKIYEQPPGIMSQYLERMKIGDSLRIKGPAGPIEYHHKGIFIYHGNPVRVKKINFCAGGTGITPVFQLIRAILRKQMPDEENKIEMSLIYSNNTEDDILLRKDLDEMARDYPESFHLWYTLTSMDSNLDGWKYGKGRINPDMIKEHLFVADCGTISLLCGPPAMLEYGCRPGLEKIGFYYDTIFEF
jgi:nitrate reductase (NAD(P)H)